MKQADHFPLISDEELVIGALVGDLAAFDELVRRFRGPVMVVAEQVTRSRAAAEDVAQDAFLLAFKALPKLSHPSKFAGWLCAIARNRARRVAARDGRNCPTERSELDQLILEHSSELATHPAEEVLRDEELRSVRGAIAKLPEETQTVMRLYYYEDWPVKRIADFLSLPITTVKWRLHHGRELMRRHLLEHREETTDERKRNPEQRNPAHPTPAAKDGRNGGGSQPYRQFEAGGPGRRASVQPSASAPGTVG